MPTLPLLVALVVIILIVLIYRPILKMARADMAIRKQDGLGNGIVYAVLLIPVVGPLVYLLVRKLMLPE